MTVVVRYWRSETSQNFRRAVSRGRLVEASQWVVHGWRVFKHKRRGEPSLTSLTGQSLRLNEQNAAKAKAHLKRARYCLSKWQLFDALQEANRSIGLWQANGGAHQVNTVVLEFLGNVEGAKAAALATYKSDPLNPKSLKFLRKYGLEEAYQDALAEILPNVEKRKWSRVAVMNARVCLLDASAGKAALALMARAKENQVFSDPVEFLALEADTLRRLRRFEEAAALYTALTEHPTRRTAALSGRAECHLELGAFELAEADAALAAEIRMGDAPRGFSNTLFHTRFHAGRCREAFQESRHRPFTRALQEDIDGTYVQTLEELRGKKSAFVLADYGVGDEIRFASIYPELRKHVKQITLSCDPRLETLFARSFPKLSFLAVTRWREEAVMRDPASRVGLQSQRLVPHVSTQAKYEMERVEAFTSIFDLLAELRPTHAAFDRYGSYLKPEPARVKQWRAVVKQGGLAGRPNIALSWRSLLRDAVRNVHYLSAADLAPLAAVDATFWLFQPCIEDDEIALLQNILPNVRVIEGLDLLDDFEGQAAFLTTMDLVVSPCTTAGELAGALGRPTLMFGRVEGTRCRLKPDGTDIWCKSMQGVVAPRGSDVTQTAAMLTDALQRHPKVKTSD